MLTLNLSSRMPASLGDTTVLQEGELSLAQWSQGLPVTQVEEQLMAIVHPTALLGIGKRFLSFMEPEHKPDCYCALCS
jgi:hypothetical protein